MSREYSFAGHRRPKLRADINSGALFIRGWEGETARVEDCGSAAIEQSGNSIIIISSDPVNCKIYLPKNSDIDIDGTCLDIDMAGIRGRGRIDFTEGALKAENWRGELAVDCTGANVYLCQYEGKAEIDSSSGSIEIQASSGEFSCDTGSGSVKIKDSTGSLFADTGGGSVRVCQFSGPVNIDTGRGDVELEAVFGRNIRVGCGSGSLTAALPGLAPGHWELTTESGAIKLLVPENISAHFDFNAKTLAVDDLQLSFMKQAAGRARGGLGREEGTIIAASHSGSIEARTVLATAEPETSWQVQDDEALKILRMLEQGAISIEETEELLAALNGEIPNESGHQERRATDG